MYCIHKGIGRTLKLQTWNIYFQHYNFQSKVALLNTSYIRITRLVLMQRLLHYRNIILKIFLFSALYLEKQIARPHNAFYALERKAALHSSPKHH